VAQQVYQMITEALARGLIPGGLEQTPLTLVLVAEGYVYGAGHEFLSSVAAADRIATSMPLRSKTFPAGVMAARKAIFVAVSGAAVTQAVLCTSVGNAAANRLVARYDLPAPFAPTGGDLTIEWDADGVLSLSGTP